MRELAFRGRELVFALLSAVFAQGVFLLVFSASPPEVRAEVPPDHVREVAISVTAVGLPKLGGGHKGHARARTRHSEQQDPTPAAAARDPVAEATPSQQDTAPFAADAGVDPAEASSAPPGEGSPEGVEHGTETDPLKAHAVALYRGQLVSWFLSRFSIRGKIPFETLKTLHAAAMVTLNPDRTVGGYSLVVASGNATFDREVRDTLSSIQSGGETLPAPPPMYPNILGRTLPVTFRCTVQNQCE